MKGGGGVGGFFFQAEDGIRDRDVTGVQTVLFRSRGTHNEIILYISQLHPRKIALSMRTASEVGLEVRDRKSVV